MAEAAGLYYETHGPADAPPLILSSGLGGSANYWAPNIPALAEHFRVIAYDHRGTGRSDRALPNTVTVDDMACDVELLADTLDIPSAHFIGHALGGLIGMALALRAPERLKRLVVVNGWARLEPHTDRCFDVRLSLLRSGGAAAYVRAQPIFLYPANWLTLDAPASAIDDLVQLAHFPGAATLEQRIAAIRCFDILERLGEISSPLLALSSSDDILVPPIASSWIIDRLAQDNEGTEYSMPWGGHACNVTDPETFNSVVQRWLTDGSFPEE